MVAIEASASGSAGMISVIVPVYNGAKFIAAAIRSVLRQTLPPDEVIIVDDGSTDQSGDIAAGFEPKLRVLRQMHRGGAAALNAGIAVSRGELLAFLDADDLWSEGMPD
jgi:glycosyltransferase involved in cell wall biosynthesis